MLDQDREAQPVAHQGRQEKIGIDTFITQAQAVLYQGVIIEAQPLDKKILDRAIRSMKRGV